MKLEARHQFTETLKELERQTMGGLDMVALQLERAFGGGEITGHGADRPSFFADDDRIDGRYLEVHQGVLYAAGDTGASGRRSADWSLRSSTPFDAWNAWAISA